MYSSREKLKINITQQQAHQPAAAEGFAVGVPQAEMKVLLQKYGVLKSCLGKYAAEGLVVAFSGGVDSGFLLWAAEEARKKYGGSLIALTTNSESMPGP